MSQPVPGTVCDKSLLGQSDVEFVAAGDPPLRESARFGFENHPTTRAGPTQPVGWHRHHVLHHKVHVLTIDARRAVGGVDRKAHTDRVYRRRGPQQQDAIDAVSTEQSPATRASVDSSLDRGQDPIAVQKPGHRPTLDKTTEP